VIIPTFPLKAESTAKANLTISESRLVNFYGMEKKLVEKYLTGFKDFILFIYFCRNSIY
jgi:hypothetical protein